MWILSTVLLLIFFGSAWIGSRKLFFIDRLTPPLVLNSLLGLLAFFTLLIIANSFGFFTQTIAAPFMMGVYTIIGGFFFGYAFRLFKGRPEGGTVLSENLGGWRII